MLLFKKKFKYIIVLFFSQSYVLSMTLESWDSCVSITKTPQTNDIHIHHQKHHQPRNFECILPNSSCIKNEF